ncbi:hypothetical protein G7067_06540 [Leucobacter insecticola]|uniref:Uncharacterized protein n=1 Tax=Leucobacter insecticola TaxID=2714934 RepID=A0A6G8FIF9_9MICO|nr:hypothetical protein [Leucobacter insecticola]QIM16155.1 hypothetical protein G7067_06540 [Leucobacter insecticola]
MSALWGADDFSQEKFDKQQQQVEELVAECMTKEGFEYKPSVHSGMAILGGEEEDGPVWGSPEFAEQYGYGIVDFPGAGGESLQPDPDEYVDPNQTYLDGLSESEQEAYWETLHGPAPTEEEMAAMEDSEGGYFEYDWKKQGCYGAAQHEVDSKENPSFGAAEDPEFKDLFTAMQDLYAPLMGEGDNKTIAELDRKWLDCMTKAGYTEYSSPNQIRQALNNEYFSEMQEPGPDGDYKEPDEKAKKEFQKKEIAVATADARCKKDLNYDAKQQEALFEIEQKFVDEHRAKLDALLAKYGAEKKK